MTVMTLRLPNEQLQALHEHARRLAASRNEPLSTAALVRVARFLAEQRPAETQE